MSVKWAKSIIILSFVVILSAFLSCTGVTPTSPARPSSETPDEYSLAVKRIADSASFEIVEWATGRKSEGTIKSPEFTKIVKYFTDSRIIQTTSKVITTVENDKTKTVGVAIPYVIGYIITFNLPAGSTVDFDVVSDYIWFETDEAYYKASVSPELYSLLKEWIESISKSSEPIIDYSILLSELRASGVSVTEEGETNQKDLFDINSKKITVNGGHIHVLEYDTPTAMETVSEYISADGYTIRRENSIISVDWIDSPHFYKAGRIIVIYLGKDETVINLVENELGKQFAGG